MPEPEWRTRALDQLPELAQEITEAESPMALWIELSLEFQRAYREANADLIARIYAYARWCLQQERQTKPDQDPVTCVYRCFFDTIPTHQASRDDMPRWFSREEVVDLRAAFSDRLGEDEWERLLQRFEPQPSLRETERRDGKRHRDYWTEKRKPGRQ